MKKLTGLIIFIVVLLIAYSAFWFYQAHRVKELAIFHIKEYEKTDDQGYHVNVDDVSVQGYPFSYVVKLKNPKYENAKDPEGNLKVLIDGAIKIGTDIFGRSYWVKQEGNINYQPSGKDEKKSKKYISKGNFEFKADVAHPQYAQAFMHPFRGLPQVFYKENPSFQEVLNELKMASYEDHDFSLYEVDGNVMTPLVTFSRGNVGWEHGLKNKEDEKFVFNFDLKDFETPEKGKPLINHLKQIMELNTDMAMDIPYILGSGKNNIAFDFETLIPKNFDIWKFFNYTNVDLALKKFEIENLYGRTSANFDLNLKENEKDNRNLHVELKMESLVSDKGAEAIHRHFIDGLKLKVAAQPADPENKVLEELLKCCEDRLQDIIPDYKHLGKMRFIFDSDIKIKDISKNGILDKIIVNHLDGLAKPYGIKSHGQAEFANDRPTGKYEIEWINYKEMIHDLADYFNRIYPIVEKFSAANNQPMVMGMSDSEKENEIVDFFKSISNDPSEDKKTIMITIDFTDVSNIKIGNHSVDQVKEAWDKLVGDIMIKPEPPKVKSEIKPKEIGPQEESITKKSTN